MSPPGPAPIMAIFFFIEGSIKISPLLSNYIIVIHLAFYILQGFCYNLSISTLFL